MFSCPPARDHSFSPLIGRLAIYLPMEAQKTINAKINVVIT